MCVACVGEGIVSKLELAFAFIDLSQIHYYMDEE